MAGVKLFSHVDSIWLFSPTISFLLLNQCVEINNDFVRQCSTRRPQSNASVNSKHQHPSPPGDPQGFAPTFGPGTEICTIWVA